MMDGFDVLLTELQSTFDNDLILNQIAFVMDAQQPMSPEIKKLRSAIARMKTFVIQVLYYLEFKIFFQ